MTKLYIDAGTSWSKVLEIHENEEKKSFIISSKELNSLNLKFDGATGHMVQNRVKPDGLYQNEMLSLAYGAKKILSDEDLQDATIVDIGSRDVKWVRFINGKYKDLDWNGNCGSATGATVEMLSKFYSVDTSKLIPRKEKIPVTCGVFAMEKIMDDIASNIPADIAIAKYINGIAYNTWNFAGNPNKIYLSGGFCLNKCFLDSLNFYCDVVPLGRLVLLEGLY
jgi:activator of 2-hydroxyglutaryl-CoA dehydratase